MLFKVSFGLGLLMGSLVGIVGSAPEGSRWKCPDFKDGKISCLCDFPRTLRCTTDLTLAKEILTKLKTFQIDETVSLLDMTLQNVTYLPGYLLEGVPLHGLVLTSGELKNLSRNAFKGLTTHLQALGLPNNQLGEVPVQALNVLTELERLDLSYNKLSALDSESFGSLNNLKFLDLSSNQISNVTSDAFFQLKNLTVVKLVKNRLTVTTLSRLTGFDNLQELDLSSNSLSGPLEPATMPAMPSLQTLSLANNQFSSICEGALKGTSALVSLTLNNNQIDVLEDHAFKELKSLRVLRLSSNRIVAISEFSLAHLPQLTELDLSHNFLRALTSDITTPLTNLRILRLDDNDISIVEREAIKVNTTLDRLTLSDNPLSCDCNLVDFAVWLNSSTTVNPSDKKTAVCMTPPHLENGLLIEVPATELRCDEDDYDLLLQEGPSATHISGSQILLRVFNFNGSSINLLWSIDTKAKSFSCDALFVYEEMSTHEVLLTSTPLKCNSSQMADPTTLVVRLGLGSMQPFHRYRYCIVLLEDNKFTDDVQLVLGCSEIIPLIVTNHSMAAQAPGSNVSTRIDSLEAYMSGDTLHVSVDLSNREKSIVNKCQVTVSVFSMGNLLAQHLLNCTKPSISVSGLAEGTYHVCASLDHHSGPDGLKCATVKDQINSEATILLTICFVLVSTFLFLVFYFAYRKIMKRSRLKTGHQCFVASNEFDDHHHHHHKQHSRYVKLQTTNSL